MSALFNQPCSHGSPTPCTSSSFALTLPPAVLPLISPYQRYTQPSQHPLICLPPSFAFFVVAWLVQHGGFAPLQAPREIKYHSTALQHLPLNPASHLPILLLMMSICSLWVKQLLTCVTHSIVLIVFVLFIPLGAH